MGFFLVLNARRAAEARAARDLVSASATASSSSANDALSDLDATPDELARLQAALKDDR